MTAIDEASNMTWSKNENNVTTSLFGEPSTIKIISIISSYHGRKKVVSSSSSICKTMIKNSNANWYHFWHWLYYSQKILYFAHIIYKAYMGILVVSTFTFSDLKRLTHIFVYFIWLKSESNSAEHASLSTLHLSVDDKKHTRVSGWNKNWKVKPSRTS